MKAVTLTAPSYMELRSIFFMRKLYIPPETKLTHTQFSELCKRFTKGYDKLKDKDEAKILSMRINKYIRELESIGTSDHEVKKLEFSYSWLLKKTITSIFLFHLLLVISIPGIILLAPFGLFLIKKAEKERIAVIY